MGWVDSAWLEGTRLSVVPGTPTLWAEDAYSVYADGTRIYEHLTAARQTLNEFTIPTGTKEVCVVGIAGTQFGAASPQTLREGFRYGETNRICLKPYEPPPTEPILRPLEPPTEPPVEGKIGPKIIIIAIIVFILLSRS